MTAAAKHTHKKKHEPTFFSLRQLYMPLVRWHCMNENELLVVCMDRQTNIIKCTLNVGTAIAFSHQNNSTKQLRHCVLLTSGNSYTVPTHLLTPAHPTNFSRPKNQRTNKKKASTNTKNSFASKISAIVSYTSKSFPVAYYRNGIPDAPPFPFVV